MILVIPLYNEESRFSDAYFRSIVGIPGIFLLFVNDGSSDRTQEILENFCGEFTHQARIISLKRNIGKANATRLGMLEALNFPDSRIGFLDGDGAFPYFVVRKAIKDLETVTDKGISFWYSRVMLAGSDINRNPMRHYAGRIIATLVTFRLPNCPYDTQAGFKIFNPGANRQQIWIKPFKTRWLFDVEIYFRLKRLEMHEKIIEIPVQSWTDKPGSKIRVLTIFRIFKEILQIWFLRLRLRT